MENETRHHWFQRVVGGGRGGIPSSWGDGTSLRRGERNRHLRQGVRASHGLKLTEFLPDYRRYGRAAPLVRNREIVAYADQVLAFWDGKSPGTKYVIDQCKKQKKTVTVHLL